jgi:hypothetical protein
LAPSSEVKSKILNTLVKLKNSGLQEQTIKIVGFYLIFTQKKEGEDKIFFLSYVYFLRSIKNATTAIAAIIATVEPAI